MIRLTPFFLFVFFILLSQRAEATDLKCGQLKSPLTIVDANNPFTIIIEIINQNVLDADSYDVTCQITDLTTDQVVYDETETGYDLKTFTETDFTFSKTYTPTIEGSYSLYFDIDFDEDIDLTNNDATFTIVVTAPADCENTIEWHPASRIRMVKDLTIFPEPDEGSQISIEYMRPGDVLGFSCLAVDEDILIEKCGCGESESTRAFGPFNDEVVYEWSIDGTDEIGGRLIIPTSNSNSIMYQIPQCISEGEYSARINCTIKNDPQNQKSPDTEITGTIYIRVTYSRRTNKPLVSAYSVGFNEDSDREYSTLISEEVCNPEELIWDLNPPMPSQASIEETQAEDFCPDYISMLSVEIGDTDVLTSYCSEVSGCGPNDSTFAFVRDPLEYEWEVISGKGSFPLGNKGPSVIFWKSRSDDAQIRCTIKDSRKQGDDLEVQSTKMVMKAKSPIAFVTVGSQHCFNNPVTGSRVGQCSVFVRSALHMKTAYENAGYLVQYSSFTDASIIENAISNPCIQAFCMVGHGAQGLMTYPTPPGGFPGGYDPEAPPAFGDADFWQMNRARWGCKKHPRIHDIRLLGCESAQSESGWVGKTHNATFFGFEEKVSFLWLEWIAEGHSDGDFSVTPPYNRSMP